MNIHIGRLDYRSRLAGGRAIGSGLIEGRVKTLGLRLNARGGRAGASGTPNRWRRWSD
jgi:hypothetical protein